MPKAAATTSLRPRRLPQRTCVGCGTVTAKRELVRIVRSAEGATLPDPTGKKAGRGAYLCPKQQCWELAIAKGRLERSLKTRISAADLAGLRSFAAGLGIAGVVG